MAIMRASPIIGAVSGRLGGTIAAQTKQGQVLKHRPAKINRRTAEALASRARFADQARAWQALTDAQRVEWNNFARQKPKANRLGQGRLLTGFQWFMKAGVALLEQTPNGARLFAGTTLVFTWSWPTETLTFAPGWTLLANPTIAGQGAGAISIWIQTPLLRILQVNVAGNARAFINVTDTTFQYIDLDTTALAASSTEQQSFVLTDDYTFFQAWNPYDSELQTFMAIDTNGLITVAGSVNNAS